MKKNVHEIEVKFEGKKWSETLDAVFNKKKKDVKIDGFRKGCVPKEIYLKKVGIESLYMDAVDALVGEAYKKALDDNKLVPVVEPKVDVKTINKDEVVFVFTIITKPEIKLGEYKNLGIEKKEVKVTKKEIEDEIKNLQSKYAEIVEKEEGTAESGNTAIIDFKGYVEGKELEGGVGENYPLELGSNSFIPGFEDAIVGMEIGEEKEVNLKFPENYTEDLKNKDVTFKITLRGLKVKELPKIDEEFFLDLGYEDVKTKEELEKKVKEDIKKHKEDHVEDEYMESCLAKASANMTIDLNEEIIDDEIHHLIHKFEEQLSMQGLNIDQYYSFTGTTHDDMHNQMKGEAEKRVKYRYLLEEIIEEEKIEVTDKEVEEELESVAKNYDTTVDEIKKEIGDLEFVRYDLKMRKAMDIVKA